MLAVALMLAYMVCDVRWKASVFQYLVLKTAAGHAYYLESDCLDSNTGSVTC